MHDDGWHDGIGFSDCDGVVSAADLVGEGVKSGWLGANVRCLRGLI